MYVSGWYRHVTKLRSYEQVHGEKHTSTCPVLLTHLEAAGGLVELPRVWMCRRVWVCTCMCAVCVHLLPHLLAAFSVLELCKSPVPVTARSLLAGQELRSSALSRPVSQAPWDLTVTVAWVGTRRESVAHFPFLFLSLASVTPCLSPGTRPVCCPLGKSLLGNGPPPPASDSLSPQTRASYHPSCGQPAGGRDRVHALWEVCGLLHLSVGAFNHSGSFSTIVSFLDCCLPSLSP